MLKTFSVAFRLKNTYRKNSILYGLKSIPIIQKLLPVSLYGNPALGIFANIVSGIGELSSIFLWKAVYFTSIWFTTSLLSAESSRSFPHLLLFLTLIGGLLNTQMFDPSRDKYYAIVLMRMDAKRYTLTGYLYFLMKSLVGALPFSLLFGLLSGVDILTCLLIPIYIVEIKLCFAAHALIRYKRKSKLKNENAPEWPVWTAAALCFAAAVVPPALGYAANGTILCITAAIFLLPALLALRYILRFDRYQSIYRTLLNPDGFINKATMGAVQQVSMQKKISIDPTQTSHKSGYAYFNELFMKRHAKLLTRSAKRITAICLILFGVTIVACRIFPEMRSQMNAFTLTFLPYFLFIMYLINRGKIITQAMFLNCDHSMLTYRFYRQPKTIVALFVGRLKAIVLINLMPAVVIAVGLPVLLYVTGGTNQPLNYVLLFISILSMSVFFSVHNIVLYYLLQPYNVNLESKSAVYGMVNSLTYVVCYLAIGQRVPTLLFGTAITVFCLLYVAVAIFLAYRMAPKTFRLRT